MKNWNNPEIVELNVAETACNDGWGSGNNWGGNWGNNCGGNNNRPGWGRPNWGNDCGGNNGGRPDCGGGNNWGDCDDDTDCMS